MGKSIEWRDSADPDGPVLSVRWNGSASFEVLCDGDPVDSFTRYGAATNGGACTLMEAYAAAAEHLARSIASSDWSAGEWPGLPEEPPFGLWICSRIGHGYHDTDQPCPEGVAPAPDDVHWQ